jgi:hypothetical protein
MYGPGCSIYSHAELQKPCKGRWKAQGGRQEVRKGRQKAGSGRQEAVGRWQEAEGGREVAGGRRQQAGGSGRNYDICRYHSLNQIFGVAATMRYYDASELWC